MITIKLNDKDAENFYLLLEATRDFDYSGDNGYLDKVVQKVVKQIEEQIDTDKKQTDLQQIDTDEKKQKNKNLQKTPKGTELIFD
jgi:hypothetical protein